MIEELDRIRCRDRAKALYLFLMFNDQRRHLTGHFESIDQHRLEFQLAVLRLGLPVGGCGGPGGSGPAACVLHALRLRAPSRRWRDRCRGKHIRATSRAHCRCPQISRINGTRHSTVTFGDSGRRIWWPRVGRCFAPQIFRPTRSADRTCSWPCSPTSSGSVTFRTSSSRRGRTTISWKSGTRRIAGRTGRGFRLGVGGLSRRDRYVVHRPVVHSRPAGHGLFDLASPGRHRS